MIGGLADVEERLARVAAGLDPAVLAGSDARAALEAVLRIAKQAEGLKVLLVGRVADTNAWAGSGDRSIEAWLARQTGGSWGDEKQAVEASDGLAACPELETAVRSGTISGRQAAAIADAARADPAAAGRLVDRARTEPLRDTRRRVEQVRDGARTAEQEAERAARQRARRRIIRGTDGDGNGLIEAHLTPGDAAEVNAELDRLWKHAFHQARTDGRHDPYEAYAADALLEMARRSRTGTTPGHDAGDVKPAPKAKVAVNVIVDLPALQRGTTTHGETCEIAGAGPVPVTWATDQLGDATLRLLLRHGTDLTTFATTSRTPTAHMDIVLALLNPECAIEGCRTRRHLETHHTTSATGWADTRQTRLQDLCRLCTTHHAQITHLGHTLTRGPTPTTWHLHPPDPPTRPPPPHAIDTTGTEPPTASPPPPATPPL